MKKAIALFLALVMCLSLAACNLDSVNEGGSYSKGLQYYPNPDGESYSVTGIGTCTDLEIIIPSMYEGKPVTEIADQAFEKCKMTAVSIPDTITSIGKKAFRYCENLVSVRIPSGVSQISDSAFSRCKSLKEVILPDSITTIGKNAFYQCSSLTNIDLPTGITAIGSYAFYECTSLTDINLPTGITKIEYYTFGGCSALTEIVIPKGVTEIDFCSFSESGLTALTIPESVAYIGQYAFQCCNLTSITIPGTVKELGIDIFNGCQNLREIKFENGVTSINTLGDDLPALESVTIPASVSYIVLGSLSKLPEIHYEGTKEQFLQLCIESSFYVREETTVYCTDGTLLPDDINSRA